MFGLAVSKTLKFMTGMKLFPETGIAFVGLSGGADSLFLTLILKELLSLGHINKLIALHVNHGTRDENHLEEAFVKEFCSNLEIELIIKHGRLDLNESNFENTARNFRQAFFKSNVNNGDRLYLGHHIDDSFEWSLMQNLKTSSLGSSLGIPLVNGIIARPLMIFTREQIERILKSINVLYINDESNLDEKFERNFIRNNLVPTIKERYPSYLKNYVARANSLASLMGLHRATKEQFTVVKDDFGGISIYNKSGENSFFYARELIKNWIEYLSTNKRGSLREQLNKCIQAQSIGKSGPLLFSGGVLGFMDQGVIHLIPESKLDLYNNWDNKNYLKLTKKGSQIPELVYIDKKSPNGAKENIVFARQAPLNGRLSSRKSIHALMPKTTQFFLDNNIWFQTWGKIFVSLHRKKVSINR